MLLVRRLQCRTVKGYPERGRARVAVIVALICGCAVVIARFRPNPQPPEELTVLVDWSDWQGPAVDISDEKQAAADSSGSVRGDLRSLVYNCSKGLDVEGLECGDDAVGRDGYRVPHFSSQPSCGFEVGVFVDRARIVHFDEW